MPIYSNSNYDLYDASLTAQALGYYDYAPMTNILARAQAWKNRPAPKPSDLITPEVFVSLLENRTNNGLRSSDPDFEEFKLKAIDKWIGKQGIPPSSPEDADKLWLPYFETKLEWQHMPHRCEEAFKRLVLMHQHGTASSCTRSYGEVIRSGELYRKMGNSGLTYNTSNAEVIAGNIREVCRLATQIEKRDRRPLPELLGYRSMRRKLRGIFNSNTGTLLYQRAKLGNIINHDQKRNDLIKYCSDFEVTQRAWAWYKKVRAFLRYGVTCVEGDAEGMDMHTRCDVCQYIVNLVLDVLYPGISTIEREEVMSCIEVSFSTPLITLNGQLVEPTLPHTLFSGQYPTNGLENWLSIAVFVMACHYADLTINNRETADFNKWVYTSFLIVCGDDVAALMDISPELQAIMPCVYQRAYEHLGLAANAAKQRVSRNSMFFCKNQHCLPGNRIPAGWVIDTYATDLPFPRYPLELALNSAVFPEEGCPPSLADNAKLTIIRLENGQYDPAIKTVLTRLQQQHKLFSRDLLKQAVASTYEIRSWEEKVFGLEAPDVASTSTYQRLMRNAF